MKKKVLVLLLIFTMVFTAFVFVSCKDTDELPSGEISSGDNNQGGDNNYPGEDGDLISAYKNFKGEEIDYSLYFKTDGNGKIIGLSDYAIEKREEIIQLEIPEKIGDEDITALSITFESLPYLRSLIIPESIQTIEETINPGNIFSFHVIYCEASSKPQGWCADWIQENLIVMDDTKVKFSAVVWDCKNNEIADDGKTYCFASSGMLYALKDSQAELAFSGKSDVENLELASAVKYKNGNFTLTGFYPLAFISTDIIKEEWFCQNNKNLKSVKIPNGLTRISDCAFYGCINLTSVEIPNSVTHIGKLAFHSCINLTDIEIPNSVTIIDNLAFYYCSSLTSIEIPSSVTTIGEETFSYCSDLTSIVIPSGVTNIGYGAFLYCSSLKVYCEAESKPSGWDNRWNYSNCPVVWDYKNNDIGYDNDGNIVYIADNGIRYLLKDGIATVAEQSGKLSGEIVIVGEIVYKDIEYAVTNIICYAFTDCSNLTSVKFDGNSKLTVIDYGAFRGCSNLTSIEIPSSVEIIEPWAFQDCNNLTNVYITDMESWCSISFGSDSNPLFYASKLYLNNELVTELKIPNGVEFIDHYAFYGYSGLESVVISSNVRFIPATAFYGCDNLNSVTFENTSWGYSLSTGEIVEPDDMDVTNPTINAANLKSGEYNYHSKN